MLEHIATLYYASSTEMTDSNTRSQPKFPNLQGDVGPSLSEVPMGEDELRQAVRAGVL